MDQLTILGIIGTVCILGAFVMNELGKWTSKSFKYDLVNVIGASILIIYSYFIASVPFLILNLVWLLVALRDVVTDLTKKS